ncbi:hypothetical protein ACFLS0_01810 [Candidatus Bipolaricaulota bacterium]
MSRKLCQVAVCVSLVILLLPQAVGAEARDSLLVSLGEVSIQIDGEGNCRSGVDVGILNPYVFQLDAYNISVDKDRYPRAREINYECDDPTVDLSLILGYCDYVQRTGNQSVLMIYTRYLFDDSFILLDGIKTIAVSGELFEPGIPILVWSSNDTIDYTNCTCGSREYHVFAVPMEARFLESLQQPGAEARIVIAPHPVYRAGTDDTFLFTNDPDLVGLIDFINGL